MSRIYSIDKKVLRFRNELIMSMSQEGWSNIDIAHCFGMTDDSWVSRIVKNKPKNFRSLFDLKDIEIW